MRPILDFDDAGATDDEPAKGVTVGDIRAWYDEVERLKLVLLQGAWLLEKRPVAWRVKDFADGWILFQDEAAACRESEVGGALMQGLYVRDGSPDSHLK